MFYIIIQKQMPGKRGKMDSLFFFLLFDDPAGGL